ncbi:MAG: hypothetical protein QOC42_07550 [Nitrososphaeraceae archaeon]|nr:hypothetical protein [Nitrososphaeraceae archaeon]MDW0236943.1 hypothetical protein [Nitrososphaeraceae archaeon]MDW0287744.1 hypothetical protein [Nitrososphaeraceae archaeon]MDW0300855.1 hypothetical protein [Nitrososphaeraceae archaeon]MDW0308344.1 hypothetical protein [Nitrososphaeraceae archaeon]
MILVTLVIENVDYIVADFIVKFNTSSAGIILFVFISVGYILGQTILMKFMNSSSSAIKSRSILIATLHRAVSIVQYVLAANVILIIIQILVFSRYSIINLLSVTFISNFFTASLLVIFALSFLSWYKNKKQSIGILLYALAFLILAVSEVVSGSGSAYLLSQKDQWITPTSEVKFSDFPDGTFFDIFFSFYRYIDYASFLLVLFASAILLYHYSKKTSNPKIVLIIALPILGYTSSILDALHILSADTNPNLFYYYIYIALVSASVGILFAFSFWIVSKKLPDSPVKTFLKITACGFVLLYFSNNISVTIAAYPPFGVNSLSLLSLASYFVLFGLYSSALSLSQDLTLRQHLRSLAKSDNNLLSSIGTAQMETEVKRAVGELKDVADEHEKELAEKTGIETPVPESEIEDYLKQVIEEVAKTRKK